MKKFIGAHVSITGGVEHAPLNAHAIGATAFALFLKNQRQWNSKDYTEENISAFKENCKKYHFLPEHILPHSSYLINLGHPEEEGLEKSRLAFLNEAKRCEQLGTPLLNIHPGTHLKKISPSKCMSRIAESINWVHEKSKIVIIVLENTAGQGSWVGHRFEDLAEIISQVNDKKRVGVCLDTCHMHAAGYKLTTEEDTLKTFEEFQSIVSFQYLKGMHLNDAKSTFASRVDRHHSLGVGTIDLAPFKVIMNDARFNNLPLILETPDETAWPSEIKKLHSFTKKNP
ncbi:MAG: deoxyribonuclease IV [Oligoflexia bacterium]|nr:deoxyribonuclease IV [Oligoflexia bacterium]MBF0366088.1 deoxyribonuclease IV [Oligoflexia bacterium]